MKIHLFQKFDVLVEMPLAFPRQKFEVQRFIPELRSAAPSPLARWLRKIAFGVSVRCAWPCAKHQGSSVCMCTMICMFVCLNVHVYCLCGVCCQVFKYVLHIHILRCSVCVAISYGVMSLLATRQRHQVAPRALPPASWSK